MTVQDNAAAMSQAVQVQEPAVKPHRSPSSMATYFRCGEYWKRTYIDKLRQPPVLPMLIGTGMHKAAQTNFDQKIASHVDLPLGDIVDAAVAGFDEALAKDGVTLKDAEKALGQEVAIGGARDWVRKVAGAFAIAQAPHYQPIVGGVERRFRIPIERSTHDVLGVIDLIAIIDGQPGNKIRDFKNSKKKKSGVDAASSDQLTAYAAGYTIEFGEPPADVGLDNLVMKAKGVERQELVETRDTGDFVVLSNKLNAMDAGIKAGIFLPADTSSWFCSANMCPFFADKSCPFVNAERILKAKAADAAEDE